MTESITTSITVGRPRPPVMDGSRRRRRGPSSSVVSGAAFRILVLLLAIAVLVSCLLALRLEAIAADGRSLLDAPPRAAKDEEAAPRQRQPHLQPRLPHLPAFPAIAGEEALRDGTLRGDRPTVAGVASVLYRHLRELHESNRRIARGLRNGPKRGGPRRRDEEAAEVRRAYFDLVDRNLRGMEDAYRGRPMFPIRRDGSVFVSVAAFREHLLGETLASAFGQAARPDKLFVGVIVNNCFGTDDDFPCKGTAEVTGRDGRGLDVLRSVDGVADANHIETFCANSTFAGHCEAGQLRVLYVHEVDALGPAVARYYSSRLWGGETYFMQVDSHLRFARDWDVLLAEDLRLTSSFPRSVLSTYPPGFVNFRPDPPYLPGTRLCRCQIRVDEDYLPRVEMRGRSSVNETSPSQTPFMGAGLFFTTAEFLVDVPFDPYLPWLFMGEEAALSVRAWTAGWDMYAPRRSLVGHQYRPVRYGNPHYWDIWGKFYRRPQMEDRLSPTTHDRIKVMLGYPEVTSVASEGVAGRRVASNYSLVELDKYGLGSRRSRQEYLQFAEIDLDKRTCGGLEWCAEGTLQ